MAVTITVTTVDATQQGIFVEGTLALTGNYPSGGDLINFLTLPQVEASSGPRLPVQIMENPPVGTAPSGYLFYFLPSTNPLQGNLYIINPSTLAQLGAGAYSGTFTGTTISFRAYFPFGV